METSAIVAHNLVKHFTPDIRAVDGIDLDVPAGQVFGFLGQNGSGKTTTVRMLTTLLRPTAGTAFVAGVDVFANPAEARRRIGVALQEIGLDDLQTGRELLLLQARLFGIDRHEANRRTSRLLDVVNLADAADRAIKGYSGGMKRRLDLACALVHEPSVIFLDEPTTGLDPVSREALWNYIADLKRTYGVTFFLTTQYMEEADRLADNIAIMERGRIITGGSPRELKASIRADAMTLTFAEPHTALALAEPVLRRLEGVEDVRVVDVELVVYVRNGSAAVAPIVRALDENGLVLAELRLTHPTLDDVFLKATGHHLQVREGAPLNHGGAM